MRNLLAHLREDWHEYLLVGAFNALLLLLAFADPRAPADLQLILAVAAVAFLASCVVAGRLWLRRR